MEIQELQELQEEINQRKEEQIKAETKLESLMLSLKSEFDCDSLAEAEKCVEELEKETVRLTGVIETKKEELETLLEG